MRQLQEKVSDRLKAISFPVFMPALDEALRALAEASPLEIASAGALLNQKGISELAFHPQCVIDAAMTCGRTPPIQLQTINRKTIVAATVIQDADTILRVAYRQAHASGASNVGEVLAEMTANRIAVPKGTVRHVLREFSEMQFIEEEWFFHRPTNPERDRLRNVTRKILSVASPIELGVIREGLRREYRYRGHRGLKTWSLLVPPRSVLRAYYEAHPEFIVEDGDVVKPVEPLHYRDELALNDAILVDALRSSPACVLDRASLAAECIRRSMNVNTFNIYLTYSPVILHLGTDVGPYGVCVSILPPSKRCKRRMLSDRKRSEYLIIAGLREANSGSLPGYRRRTMPPIWSSMCQEQSGITCQDGSLTQRTRMVSATVWSG